LHRVNARGVELPFNGILILPELNARSYLHYLLPLVHDIPINSPPKGELKVHTILVLSHYFALFIDDGVNLSKLNCQTTCVKSLVLLESNFSPIFNFPSKTYFDRAAQLTPFQKRELFLSSQRRMLGGTGMVFLINYLFPELMICKLVPLDPGNQKAKVKVP
jgi:hypothetical protein